MVRHIPEGTHTVTPHLVLEDGVEAIDFYVRAFGAHEHYRMPGPGGGIAHAELRIGDSILYFADESPQGAGRSPRSLKGSSVVIHLYVEDVDGAIQRAVDAGAQMIMPPMDMFWGDRFGQVQDPFGHLWSIATHKEDVSPEDMARRGAEAMAAMASAPRPRKAARPAKKKTKAAAKKVAATKAAPKGKARRKR
jgi:uncharacterized glyoxalase superfamily protein PhnB